MSEQNSSPAPSIMLSEGNGQLQKVTLAHKCGASAEVYLFGAELTSWKTADGKERIFVSPGAIWDGKKAIRGGAPLVFPQFGQPDKSMPQHGFVRTSFWTVSGIKDSGDAVSVQLTICDDEATRKLWPHAFKLLYNVVLTAESLHLSLEVQNTGDTPFSFQSLLHTYFQISDIADVLITGLSGKTYVDKVAGGETKTESSDKIEIPCFTDRVYVGAGPEPVGVVVSTKDGTVLYDISNMASIGSGPQACDVVVWNPYEEASPGDLPPPAFKNFVCVEPGMVSQSFGLPAGQSATVAQTIKAM